MQRENDDLGLFYNSEKNRGLTQVKITREPSSK